MYYFCNVYCWHKEARCWFPCVYLYNKNMELTAVFQDQRWAWNRKSTMLNCSRHPVQNLSTI